MYPKLLFLGVLPSRDFSPYCGKKSSLSSLDSRRVLVFSPSGDNLAHALSSAEVSGRRVDAEAQRQDTGEGTDSGSLASAAKQRPSSPDLESPHMASVRSLGHIWHRTVFQADSLESHLCEDKKIRGLTLYF